VTSYTKKRKIASPALDPAVVRDVGKADLPVDFQPGDFDEAIRDHGYLNLWSSAEFCPCRSNKQTDQPDPNCELCDGTGFVYLKPIAPTLKDYLKKCPPSLTDTDDAKITQSIITSQSNNPSVYENFGEWQRGTAGLTTFSWNKLGYRDRFEHYEAEMTYRQVVKLGATRILAKGKESRQQLRYTPLSIMRVLRRTGNATLVDITEDAVVSGGTIDLTGTSAVANEHVSVSYRFHPIWIITEFPYLTRGQRQHQKLIDKELGEHEDLPVHAVVMLDFLLKS
jgi:hypothetical protein